MFFFYHHFTVLRGSPNGTTRHFGLIYYIERLKNKQEIFLDSRRCHCMQIEQFWYSSNAMESKFNSNSIYLELSNIFTEWLSTNFSVFGNYLFGCLCLVRWRLNFKQVMTPIYTQTNPQHRKDTHSMHGKYENCSFCVRCEDYNLCVIKIHYR